MLKISFGGLIILSCILVITSLHNRKRIRHLNQQFDSLNRATSAYLTSLSHELRTPLNIIAGYADILLMGLYGPVTESQIEQLNRIKASQKHALNLLQDAEYFADKEWEKENPLMEKSGDKNS